jgi:hypothetical protein
VILALNRLRGWRRWEQLFRSRIPNAQKKPMHPGTVRSRFVSIRHLLEHQRPAPSRDRILRKTRRWRANWHGLLYSDARGWSMLTLLLVGIVVFLPL